MSLFADAIVISEKLAKIAIFETVSGMCGVSAAASMIVENYVDNFFGKFSWEGDILVRL